jgi:hypothetical protein
VRRVAAGTALFGEGHGAKDVYLILEKRVRRAVTTGINHRPRGGSARFSSLSTLPRSRDRDGNPSMSAKALSALAR